MGDSEDRESKTEEPTPKKLQDAREKGNTPYSRELLTASNYIAIWAVLSFLIGGACLDLMVSLRPFLERPAMWDIRSSGDVGALAGFLGGNVLIATGPLLVVLALSGLTGTLLQFNGAALKRLKPEPSRLSPLKGFGRIFGRKGLTFAAKSLLTISVIGIVTAWSIRNQFSHFAGATGLNAVALASLLVQTLASLTVGLAVVMVAIAVLDLLHTHYTWRKDHRMTKQEIRDEAKESDGDMQLKQRMRFVARQRLKRRMMAAVPKATVVIANPTHYAVALRYDAAEGQAPVVVAKGKDSLALRIRVMANEHNVPVVEDKPLARALYDNVPLEVCIPPQFYRAVALIISALVRSAGKPKKGSRSQVA